MKEFFLEQILGVWLMHIDKNYTNPLQQLNQAKGRKMGIMKDRTVDKIDIKDIYKKEDYEFTTPGIFGTGFLSKNLDPAGVLKRLSKGRKVVLKEHIEIGGTYDGLNFVASRGIDSKEVETELNSMADLEEFARVESGAAPKTEREKIAQLLEGVEFKKVPEEGNNNYYEIINSEGETISSTNAAKLLEGGEIIQLREKSMKGGRHVTTSLSRKNRYGHWLGQNPNNLDSNQTVSTFHNNYGHKCYHIQTTSNRVEGKETDKTVIFNSLEQVSSFLKKG